MKCPQCNTPYECPCRHCLESNDSKWKRINMTDDDWDEVCPGCGKTESVHWWFEEEFRQYNASKDVLNGK